MRSSVIGSRDGSARSLGSIQIASLNPSTSSLSPSETSMISPTHASKKNFSEPLIPTCKVEHRRNLSIRLVRFIQGLPSRLLLSLISLYQVVLSPLLGPACRYEPTCSCYASQSIQRHGFLRGSWFAVKRLCRCHPFSKHSGLDPVPPSQTPSQTAISSKESE